MKQFKLFLIPVLLLIVPIVIAITSDFPSDGFSSQASSTGEANSLNLTFTDSSTPNTINITFTNDFSAEGARVSLWVDNQDDPIDNQTINSDMVNFTVPVANRVTGGTYWVVWTTPWEAHGKEFDLTPVPSLPILSEGLIAGGFNEFVIGVLKPSNFDSTTGVHRGIIAVNWGNFSPDTTPPVINCTFNISTSNIKVNDVINFSCNATDETELSTLNMTFNYTSGIVYSNYTVTTPALISNVTTIPDVRGNVINFTAYATDTNGNVKQNSTVFTVVNAVPIPTIILPTANDYNNTQPNYPFNITFPADLDGDSITTVKYYINGIINQTISPVTNTTFNASDGYYILNVSLFDGFDWGANATVNFTIDTTVPTLLLFNLTNNTIFGFNVNATMNITMQDTNPFLLQFNWHNASIDRIYNVSNITQQTATTISIVYNLNLTGLASGNYTLDINFSDRSTVFAIENYAINPIADGLNFRTKEGNDITIVQTFGKTKTEIKTKKLVDRYTFDFGKTEKREQRKYLVIADNPIHIPKNQDHKGHLIVSKGIGGNWISFDNKDRDSEVTVVRIGENMVKVTVYSNNFEFQSIGGLNVVNVFYNFQVDNHAPEIESSINDTTPEINSIVNISGNASDIIAVSTIFIGHNNSGTWVNQTNTTVPNNTTNDINLDYLLTVTASQGKTIGAMVCANDTFNQFSCGDVHTMQVNDTTAPTFTTATLNATLVYQNQSINASFTVADNFNLKNGQIRITQNGEKRIYNFTLSGTTDAMSQNFTVTGPAPGVITINAWINDTFNNSAETELLAEVTKDMSVTAKNIYDNTTINEFIVTIFNSTFNETRTTTTGKVNFTNIVTGLYGLRVNSTEEGGYFSQIFNDLNATNNFVAHLHQSELRVRGRYRGTDINISQFNISTDKIFNTSTTSDGVVLFMNSSNFTMTGASAGFYDAVFDANLTPLQNTTLFAEFADINVSIAIFSIANGTWLKNFTIALDNGASFSETKQDANKGNITFSLGNNTYFITVSADEFSPATFSFILNSTDQLFPNLSFSIAGLNSLNISIFDEITNLPLLQNSTIDIIGLDTVRNFSTENGFLYLQDLTPDEYRLTYNSEKYTKRDYYVTVANQSNTTVRLFLLTTTNGTEVEFTVQDNSGTDLEGALVRLKRYYISTNSYVTIAMSKTNSEGKTIIDVDFNDAFYETQTTFQSFSLRTIGAKIISTTLILTMDLLPDPFTTINAIQDMTTSISFTNATQTFVYVFTDNSGGTKTGQLDVIKRTATTDTIVCTATDTSVSGTLLCQVNTTLNPGNYLALGKIVIGGDEILTNSIERETGLRRDFKNTFGTQGAFFTIIIAGTLAGLGAGISPAVAIIMFLVGLGVVNFLGFSIWGLTLYVSFVIAGLILIFKMKK